MLVLAFMLGMCAFVLNITGRRVSGLLVLLFATIIIFANVTGLPWDSGWLEILENIRSVQVLGALSLMWGLSLIWVDNDQRLMNWKPGV